MSLDENICFSHKCNLQISKEYRKESANNCGDADDVLQEVEIVDE